MPAFPFLYLLFLILPVTAVAEKLHIAVASNFAMTMKKLQQDYQSSSPHKLSLVFGSTGKHYAQIKHGAPFDLFFAADSLRPQRLEQEGLTVSAPFTYALGKLVLWSATPNFVQDNPDVLKQGGYYHLALGNPKLAPYGRAAKEVLESLGLWKSLQPKMVRGENIGQTLQFVQSGNAELGFVAYSQIVHSNAGDFWSIPETLYTPIVQQAVSLRDTPASQDFMRYMQSPRAHAILIDNGYTHPNAQ